MKTTFSEFNSYCKCPLVWKRLYLDKKSIFKKLTYKDYVYNSNISSNEDDENFIKANAIKDYIKNLSEEININNNVYRKHVDINSKIDNIVLDVNEFQIELPKPDVYVDDDGCLFVLTTSITSNTYELKTYDVLSNLQAICLSKIFSKEFNILSHIIHPASLRKKKAETDEEFEQRKAELIKKSKTGISRAVKQTGESSEEFFKRYRAAISSEYRIDLAQNNNVSEFRKNILSKLSMFFKDRLNPESVTMNNFYCKFCDVNTVNGCQCFSDYNVDNSDNMIEIKK